MALDIKAILVDALLDLCEKKSVEKITVKDILDKTGLSKKAFYNHFRDKNDLIIYCYQTRVFPPGSYEVTDIPNLTQWNIEWFENMKRHQRFMKGACSIEDPNSLKNHLLTHGRAGDLAWYKETFTEGINEDLELCISYHAGASRYIIIEWILSDMKMPVKTLAALININRTAVLNLIRAVNEGKAIEDFDNLYKHIQLQ